MWTDQAVHRQGADVQSGWGRWGQTGKARGGCGGQLAVSFVTSLHEELRLETHSYPAVLIDGCGHTGMNDELGLRFDRWVNGLVMWRGAKRICGLTSLAPVRSTGDTRPNPVTFAADVHDALAAVTSQQILPEAPRSLKINPPNGAKRDRTLLHLSPVRGPKSTRIVELREMHAVGSGGLDAVKSHT